MVARVSLPYLTACAAAAIAMHLGGPGIAVAQNLVANPLLARDLPPTGWLGEHRKAWVKQHSVYASTCATGEVTAEIRYLNRAIAYDEYLLSLAGVPDIDNPVAARLAIRAKSAPDSLRKDIAVADSLVVQLRLLPPCDNPAPPAMPQPAGIATNAAATVPAPATDAPAVAPPSATDAPRAPPPAPAPESPSTAAAPLTPSSAAVPEPAASDRLVIRFDDKVAALTPSGVRAFNEAIAAARSGKIVQLAIEGCNSGADFSNGSPCARRLQSLKRRLAEAGAKEPGRFFPGAP